MLVGKVHKYMEIGFHTHTVAGGGAGGKVWERCTMGKADAGGWPANLSSTG